MALTWEGKGNAHKKGNKLDINSPVHLVLSPTYALIYIIKILSQAITLVVHYTTLHPPHA